MVVNGHDLTDAVCGVSVTSRAGHLSEVELDLRVYMVDTYGDGAEVLIPPATRDALIALGWTPPP